MHFLAYFTLQCLLIMLSTLHKIEDHENHVRWIYLATVLNMGESWKYARRSVPASHVFSIHHYVYNCSHIIPSCLQTRKGRITRKELRKILNTFKFRISSEQFRDLMFLLDPQNTNSISYHKFLDLFEEKESKVSWLNLIKCRLCIMLMCHW